MMGGGILHSSWTRCSMQLTFLSFSQIKSEIGSSAQKGLAEDALNVNNMNVNPGEKQQHLCTTTIPTNNPPPKPGHPDTQGQLHEMVYAINHPDLKLQGQPKGMKAVLQEQESVWDELVSRCKGNVVRKCKECLKLQAKKDVERWVAEVEAM